MSNLDLSIIILSYKSKEHLKVLLPSIFASKDFEFAKSDVIASASEAIRPLGRPELSEGSDKIAASDALLAMIPKYSAEIIIVDNDSRDGTIEWLQEQLNKETSKQLNIIQNQNLGFSHGNNLGIKQSSGKYVLLLNPDTKLEVDTLQSILDFMKGHPDIGIGGCKIVKPDGKLDLACRRRFPNPLNSFKRLFLLNDTDYNYSNIDVSISMEVDSLVGAFMFIRREVLNKIGLLDEKFFMYGEDIDFCWRCKEVGFKVWYYPKTFITHYKGASSEKQAFKSLKWFHDAMWIFYSKHYKQKYPFILSWAVWLGIKLRFYLLLIVNLFRSKPRVSK